MKSTLALLSVSSLAFASASDGSCSDEGTCVGADEATMLQMQSLRDKIKSVASGDPKTANYHYGQTAGGGNTCWTSDVDEAECLAAVQSLLPKEISQGRTDLVAGSWGWVPPGCSVQSHFTHNQDGDWAAHFNSDLGGQNDGGYTKVCVDNSNEPVYVVASANSKCPHQNDDRLFRNPDDGSDSITLEQCYAQCATTEGCNHFSFGPWQGGNVCMGCISLSNAQTHAGFTTYDMPGVNLENGGFEEGFTPEETGNTHTMGGSGYEYTGIFPGWTAAGGTVMVASGNGPWGGIVASSGDNLLALQSAAAEIKQTVSNLRAGVSYTLTVNAAQRTNSPGGTNAALKVSVNGQELMNEVVSSTTMEAQVMTFTADSSLAEIKIENDVASGDQTVFVDGITLTEAF